MSKKTEPRVYESEALGLPPLKMVLVHAETERRKRPAQKANTPRESKKNLENLKAVVKLIDHLMETD